MTVLFEVYKIYYGKGKNDFFTVTMASTSKAFKKCVHPCPCYLTPDDHMIFASFVWARSTHAMFSRERYACTVSFSR